MSRCYKGKDDIKCMITASGETVCGYQGDGTTLILGLVRPELVTNDITARPIIGLQQGTEHFIDLVGMINKTFRAKENYVNSEIKDVESFEGFQPSTYGPAN